MVLHVQTFPASGGEHTEALCDLQALLMHHCLAISIASSAVAVTMKPGNAEKGREEGVGTCPLPGVDLSLLLAWRRTRTGIVTMRRAAPRVIFMRRIGDTHRGEATAHLFLGSRIGKGHKDQAKILEGLLALAGQRSLRDGVKGAHQPIR